MSELDKLFQNSDKAEYLDSVSNDLKTATKAITILINERENGNFTITTHTVFVKSIAETIGIIEMAKLDIITCTTKG